ncbi:hypothetical protein RQP54_06400 [Curvibacter sp. APW13]|uniref:hypothetical protein n=1 Tax=Curvibacter sp. APW13 TaxID=3077236 RepID=UPI0028E02698|nr:hypothetical protein [Curvibacter sp. APW13]MDT8990494.1 hypothetical protein [Curvibacter sp. APW13]
MTIHRTSRRRLAWVPAILALACALPIPLHATTTPGTPVSPTASATFATDAAVREGMQGVRDIMAVQEERIRTGALAPSDYRALAVAIDAQLHGRLAQRALPKASAVAFQASVWQDLTYCVGLMRDGRSLGLQRTGAFGVQQVLRNYGQFFDHPGW